MPAPPGRPVAGDAPGVGTESVGGILGRDAALQGETPWRRQSVLSQSELLQALPVGDAHLAGDQVDVGDLFGHRVLDLDARIHLDEHVMAALVEQELDGARVHVVDLARERDRVGAHPVPQFGGQVRRGRELDDLLVAPLHAAVAFEQVHHVAVLVGQNLDLDMPRVDHRLLEIDRRVTERRLGLAAGRLDGLGQRGRIRDAPHPAASAAGHRLDEQREFHRRGRRHKFVRGRRRLR